jgi:hypothetical protein
VPYSTQTALWPRLPLSTQSGSPGAPEPEFVRLDAGGDLIECGIDQLHAVAAKSAAHTGRDVNRPWCPRLALFRAADAERPSHDTALCSALHDDYAVVVEHRTSHWCRAGTVGQVLKRAMSATTMFSCRHTVR